MASSPIGPGPASSSGPRPSTTRCSASSPTSEEGCNVGGPYTLSTEVDQADDTTTVTVTVTGHDYRSDGGECAEIASAEAELNLPTLAPGDRHQLEIRLDERSNTFVLEATADGIVATERSGDNVRLSCRDRDEEPTSGCTAPVEG